MQISGYDANYLLLKIQVLDVLTTDLREDALIISVDDLENRWRGMLGKMQECFYYAHLHQVYLGEHKEELRHIIENLHSVEKALKNRKSNPPKISDAVAARFVSIADKIDKVLLSFGWRPVVRPITEAVFHIPRQLKEIFFPEEPVFPSPSSPDLYLPPIDVDHSVAKGGKLLSESSVKRDTIIDAEAYDVEERPETLAEATLRRLKYRIDKRLAGDEVDG